MANKEYHEEIVTKRMTVIDDEKRTRAVTGVAPNGETEFKLFDESQTERVFARVGNCGATVGITDWRGNSRAKLRYDDEDCEAVLNLTSTDKDCITLSAGPFALVRLTMSVPEQSVVSISADEATADLILRSTHEEMSGASLQAKPFQGRFVAEAEGEPGRRTVVLGMGPDGFLPEEDNPEEEDDDFTLLN